jgi:N-acetylmuramate 1-kinase
MDSNQERHNTRLAWARSTLGNPDLTLASASADASFRSYWRTQYPKSQSESQSWIVMDSPPAQEDPRPWLAIGDRLSAAGLHVPAVRAHDLQQGFLLIEDLGSRLYLPALSEGTVDALYGDAMNALLRMQTSVDVIGMQPYDQEFLRREMEIMPEWLLGRHLGRTLDADDAEVLDTAFEVLLDSALEQPRCFVHRDYHSRNLLIVEPDSPETMIPGLLNPGIIDFQGALRGPITYDLASLLRDCYIVWDRERVESWVEDYRLRLQAAKLIDTTVDRERFLRWFDLIGLQRHIKVLGLFCRLGYRDGKLDYLNDLPRVYDYVISVARGYPELTGLVALLERCTGDRDLRIAVTA